MTRLRSPRRRLLCGLAVSCVVHAALLGWFAGRAAPTHAPAVLDARSVVLQIGLVSAAGAQQPAGAAAPTGSRSEPVRQAAALTTAQRAKPAEVAAATTSAGPSVAADQAVHGDAAGDAAAAIARDASAGSDAAAPHPVTPAPPAPGRPAGPQALPGNPLPAYPQAAREDGLEGRVVLKLAIDRDGRVAEVRIVQRSGANVLDFAAAEAAWSWRFKPASDGREPIASHTELAIRFVLQGQGQGPTVRGDIALATLRR